MDIPRPIPQIVHTDEDDVTEWPEPPRPLDGSDSDADTSINGELQRLSMTN